MKKLFALALVAAMMLSCVSALAADPVYDAFSGYLMGSGREAKLYKPTEFIETKAANMLYEKLYYFTVYGLAGQEDPAVIAHWASLGLTKKVYDADDADHMWSVFVPTGHEFGEDYKFPVVFCLHGNQNDIMLAETYGFAELGGREGFITICPWASNGDILIEEIPRILDTVRGEYSIDESRIYVTGFSKGGVSTLNAIINYPELFAAAAPGGIGPLGKNGDGIGDERDNTPCEPDSQLYWAFDQEKFDALGAAVMPICFFGGTADSMPIATPEVNYWITVSGAVAPEMTPELLENVARNSAYGVERMTGLQYQTLGQMEVRHYDEQNYYIGSYYNEDGVCTFRLVAVEGAPHWLMPSEAEVVWEFLSQFARDPETHELIYLNK